MRLGVVSYNTRSNFTNYGSALQSWALHEALRRCGHDPVLVDYCPERLAGKDPLNPVPNMWDVDDESRRLCEMSLPAIRVNASKFDAFYTGRFERTPRMYSSLDFDAVATDEGLDGFVCGSDTIFNSAMFGFDDGYWASYPCMRGRSIAYAASFGDAPVTGAAEAEIAARVGNFRAISLREGRCVGLLARLADIPVCRAVDPTLLLDPCDYASLTAGPQEDGDYLLLYSRRYDRAMEACAEVLAERMGWKIVEISLRAENARRHRMFYEAGVEEFLSLVKGARFLVTNSYHGVVFSCLFGVPFYVYLREQCENKITELLTFVGLRDRLMTGVSEEGRELEIDWAAVGERILRPRADSWGYLEAATALLGEFGGGL